MPEAAIQPIRRDQRDGVPVFWSEGQDGPLMGTLMFRVGVADEAWVTRGLTHLVEHLTLFGLGSRPAFEFNGVVELLRTLFFVLGTPEQVVGFMNHLGTALNALPVERVDAEAGVLRAEAVKFQPGVFDHHLWLRFGTRGPGMLAVAEKMPYAPDPGLLTAWARSRFTAANATAWFSGPIPEGLSFAALPQGERHPCPEPVPLAWLRTPAVFPGPSGRVAVSVVTERDDWIGVPLQVALRRLQERLRWQQGLAYQVAVHSIPIATRVAHSLLTTTCTDNDAPDVQAGFLAVLDELAQKGIAPAELAEARAGLEEAERNPAFRNARLDVAAFNGLLGYQIRSSEEMMAELATMTPESSAAAVSRALPSALMMLPPRCPPARFRFQIYPEWSGRVAVGRAFRPPGFRGWLRRWPRLIVGKAAVSLVPAPGRVITVSYAECAGALVDVEGNLEVVGLDGFRLVIRPAEWKDGVLARDTVLRALRPDQVLRLGLRRNPA